MSQYFRPDAGADRTQTSGLLQIPRPANNMALGSVQLRLLFLHVFAFCRIEECMVLNNILFSAHQAAVGFVTTIKSSRPSPSAI